MSIVFQLIGGTAALLSTFAFLPQIVVAWKARNNPAALAGVSAATIMMMFSNATLWIIYNASIENWWGVLPNTFVAPGMVLILWVLWKGRREGVLGPAGTLTTQART
ncbi:hypothetical protein [Aeromicrobium sp. 179-A 4D2 NHS]|uniref:hypothetical protein n=1 Tax=Aeromicrobium sp. 179-A 4D2 NHS TaxID=3142375 RepID=UPI0039A23D6C